MCTSMVSSNFALPFPLPVPWLRKRRAVQFCRSSALLLCTFTSLRHFYLLVVLTTTVSHSLIFNNYTHTSGSSLYHLCGRLKTCRVKVRHLCLGDLFCLRSCQRSDLFLVRFAGCRVDTCRFLSRTAAGGVLQMKVKDLSA